MSAPDSNSINNIWVIAVGNLLGIVALIVRSIFTERSNAAKRKSDIEDREQARIDDQAAHDRRMEAVRLETARLAAIQLRASEKRHDTVIEKIEENTKVNGAALEAANNVNHKIQELGLENKEKQEILIQKVAETESVIKELAPIIKKEV